jgi:hypothetical protein
MSFDPSAGSIRLAALGLAPATVAVIVAGAKRKEN